MERILGNAIERTERTLEESRRLIARSKELIEESRTTRQASNIPTKAKTKAPYVPPSIHTLQVNPSIASSTDVVCPEIHPNSLPQRKRVKAKQKPRMIPDGRWKSPES
jgi:hypothetical protein